MQQRRNESGTAVSRMKSGFSTEKSGDSLYASYAGMIQIRYKGHRQHLYLSPFRRTPLLYFYILVTLFFCVNLWRVKNSKAKAAKAKTAKAKTATEANDTKVQKGMKTARTNGLSDFG